MAAKNQRIIVTCAVTGAIHVPTSTSFLPITPAEIAESAIGAASAGAAIVHLHARDPETGKPTADPGVFSEFLPAIADGCDAIVNLSTGGGMGMALADRIAAAKRFQPELCSLNMGSMNFGMFPMLDSITRFKHEWERPYLEQTRDYIFKNTFADLETITSTLGEFGTRFEFECYDVGHLYTLAYILECGWVKPPLFVQAVLGILGGIGPDAENLFHMKATADRLFGGDYHLSVLGAGRHQTRLVTLSLILGGNVRVGLEDSIYLEKGRLAESNAQQVDKVVRIARELSLEVATPDEGREMLGLKGQANTAIGL